jgi:acetyl-CoA acyltransferase
MTDVAVLLAEAIRYALGAAVPGYGVPGDLARPTPCAEWDLGTLLGHLAESMAALSEALTTGNVGISPAPACGGGPASGVRGDPVEVLRDRAAELLCATFMTGDQLITIEGIPVPAGIVVTAGAVEIAVHGWDVSAARGRARPVPAKLAGPLVRLLPQLIGVRDGLFCAPVTVSPQAAPGARLVAYLGRDPARRHWLLASSIGGYPARKGGPAVPRTARDVVFVDGVRTPFGKAGPSGLYAQTRADDLVVSVIRELLRRNPSVEPARIGEVAIAATTQIGDQGLTIGRSAAVLAGLPKSVPGYAIDRMCAGAMTAATNVSGAIAFGAVDIAIAGGVEHMGHHPMGEGVDPNPRFVSERLVDTSALVMGASAENLHDRFPAITRGRADAYAAASQRKVADAYAAGKIQPDLVPVGIRDADGAWGLATADEPPRPGTTVEGLAGLKTPFRPHGRVTAGNSAGLNDGATGCLLAAEGLGLPGKMRLVDFAFAGVDPEVMGIGPVPATETILARNSLTMDDISLIEINEAFAVQVLAFLDHFKIDDEDPRVNPWGGAIALGHPLASSGVRLMMQLARQFADHPAARYGLTTMCVGMGMGGTVLWEKI